MQDFQFNQSWTIIETALKSIFHQNVSHLSFEQLYRTAYTIVLKKHAPQLYEHVCDEIKNELKSRPQVLGLQDLVHAWNLHQVQMKMVSDILMYLDRVYSEPKGARLIYDQGLELFRKVVVHDVDGVSNKLLELIQIDRSSWGGGAASDIRDVVSMLEFLPWANSTVWSAVVEERIITATREYYEQQIESFIEGDPEIYVRRACEWVKWEQERGRAYFGESVVGKVVEVVQDSVVEKQFLSVLERGLEPWIQAKKWDIIQLAWKNWQNRTDIGPVLRRIVESRGNLLNRDDPAISAKAKNGRALKWVDDVLTLKDEFDLVLELCFDNDTTVRAAAEAGLSDVVNAMPRFPEYLSMYMDDHMKKQQADLETEQILDKAIILFRFVDQKDLFETYYKAHFAKRLLNNRATEEVERGMISRLKLEVGTAFTAKLESMVRDMQQSKEMMKEFKQLQISDPDEKELPNLSVTVLTSSIWPLASTSSFNLDMLPRSLKQVLEKFESYYSNLYKGRKLTWSTSLGTCDLSVKYLPGVEVVSVPVPTMIVLLMFDPQFKYLREAELTAKKNEELGETETDSEKHLSGKLSDTTDPVELLSDVSDENIKLTFDELLTLLPDFSSQELHRQLQTLSSLSRQRFLLHDKATNTYSLNYKLKGTKRMRVNPIKPSSAATVGKSSENTKSATPTSHINDEVIDSAIVRIMKTQQELENDELLKIVNEALFRSIGTSLGTGMGAKQVFKKRVESLIEREYIVRNPEKRGVYMYVAS